MKAQDAVYTNPADLGLALVVWFPVTPRNPEARGIALSGMVCYAAPRDRLPGGVGDG